MLAIRNTAQLAKSHRRVVALDAKTVKRIQRIVKEPDYIVSEHWTPSHIDVTHDRVVRGGSPGKGDLMHYHYARVPVKYAMPSDLDKLMLGPSIENKPKAHYELAMSESYDARYKLEPESLLNVITEWLTKTFNRGRIKK